MRHCTRTINGQRYDTRRCRVVAVVRETLYSPDRDFYERHEHILLAPNGTYLRHRWGGAHTDCGRYVRTVFGEFKVSGHRLTVVTPEAAKGMTERAEVC